MESDDLVEKALQDYILWIIGDDEPVPMPHDRKSQDAFYEAQARNKLRQEQRKRLNNQTL